MIFSEAANTIYGVTTPVRIESRPYMRMAIRNHKYVPGQSSTIAMLKQHWQVGSAWKEPSLQLLLCFFAFESEAPDSY